MSFGNDSTSNSFTTWWTNLITWQLQYLQQVSSSSAPTQYNIAVKHGIEVGRDHFSTSCMLIWVPFFSNPPTMLPSVFPVSIQQHPLLDTASRGQKLSPGTATINHNGSMDTSWQCGQFCLPRKPLVVQQLLPPRHKPMHLPGVLSDVFAVWHLERQTPINTHESPSLPGSHHICHQCHKRHDTETQTMLASDVILYELPAVSQQQGHLNY